MKRTSVAVWNGTGKEGSGNITTQSQILNKAHYKWASRFEEAQGTNPEELMAAAHAGCFTMKLSFLLVAAGFTAEKIETSSTMTLESGTITESHLVVKASVPGISADKFKECAEDAKVNCPVSKALNMSITMEASLL